MPSVVIVFAYHFPPDPAIGGARPYRFYKYLRRLGYRVHVITASPQPEANPDVEYVPDPFLSGMKDMGWQVERLVRRFLMPGVPGTRWAHSAKRRAQDFLHKQTGRTTIFSTCPPFGTHYAAWQLARAEKLPWIADFRDPFGGISMNMVGFNGFHRVFFNWIERRIVQSADLVIANTDAMTAEWKQLYASEAGKIHLIWNGFDPEEPIPPKPLPERNYQVLSHVGELYAGRTVVPVLESIDRLVNAGLLPPIQVRVIGPAKASAIPDAVFVARGASAGWLDLSTESVSQQEAREISQRSDGLLLIQPQSAIQVPGKLYEYLQIGRPILAFIMRNSPIERILSKSGLLYRCVYPDSTNEERDATIAEFFGLPTDALEASDWFRQNFQAEMQARTLAGFVESLRRA